MSLGSALSFGGCLGRLNSPSVVAVTAEEASEMHSKLVVALRKKQREFQAKFKQEMSFTRVLLKLGTVRTFMIDVRRVFNERDTDSSGRIDISEMTAAMKDLQVSLSEDEVKALFQMADFYEDNKLTMKQFLVVLAMGYVLDAIPDLMETAVTADKQEVTPGGRRMSNFYNKERAVRDALGLFTYAYLLFDKECKGVISRDQVMIVVAENGQKDEGSMSILSQERWDEMDWDSNGDISFGEFVYAFTKWVDVDGEDTVEERANSDVKREGGQSRRKSSVGVARKTSVIAKEITRRISSALLTRKSSSVNDGDTGVNNCSGNINDGQPAGSSMEGLPAEAAGASASDAVTPAAASVAPPPSAMSNSPLAAQRSSTPKNVAFVEEPKEDQGTEPAAGS